MKKKSQKGNNPMETLDKDHPAVHSEEEMQAQQAASEAALQDEVAQEHAMQDVSGAAEVPVEEASILLQQITDLQNQLDQQKDATLRAHADLDNYRRRMMREKDELKKKITGDMLESILPTIDTMKLGLETSMQQHPEAKGVIDGFQMVFDQFQKALESQGIKAINPEGEDFDPHQHECLAQQPSNDIEGDKVMQVVRFGYKFNDRVLRPASVIVSSGKPQKAEGNE